MCSCGDIAPTWEIADSLLSSIRPSTPELSARLGLNRVHDVSGGSGADAEKEG